MVLLVKHGSNGRRRIVEAASPSPFSKDSGESPREYAQRMRTCMPSQDANPRDPNVVAWRKARENFMNWYGVPFGVAAQKSDDELRAMKDARFRARTTNKAVPRSMADLNRPR
jgi:hypothetical protein